MFSPSSLAYPCQSRTLFNEGAQNGGNGSPPCSIWRSFNNELPNTCYRRSRKVAPENVGKAIRAATACNAHWLGLQIGSFQGKCQIAKSAPRGASENYLDHRIIRINRDRICNNTTPCSKGCIEEHRCFFTWRKINIRVVQPKKHFSTIIETANWDGCWDGCGAAGGGGSAAGTGANTAGGGGGGAGTIIWIVATIATVATPPTPAWMCCHARDRVF